MTKTRGWRKMLRGLAIGCGSLALLIAAFVVWVGVDIYQQIRDGAVRRQATAAELRAAGN